MIGVWCIAISNLEICFKWPKKQGTKDMKQIKNWGYFYCGMRSIECALQRYKAKKVKI